MIHYLLAFVFVMLGAWSLVRFGQPIAAGAPPDWVQLLIGLVCLAFAGRRLMMARRSTGASGDRAGEEGP